MTILKNSYSDPMRIIFFILTVLLTFNTLLLPFDKIILPVYILLLLCTTNWVVSKNLFYISTIIVSYISLIFFVNLQNNDPLIIYPFLFILAAFLAAKNRHITLGLIKSALLVNILLGFVLLIAYYLGLQSPYVGNLLEKGIPLAKSPIGFSPTTQVYGTLCLTWILISFESKDNSFLRFLVAFTIILTLNRVSIAFLLLILLFYRRTLFYVISSILVFLLIVYFDLLVKPLLNTGTLNSRIELRRGAEISYWQSDNLSVWIFGLANHQTTSEIAQKTRWEREYIENGLDFILHSYGALGLLFYLLALFSLLTYLIKRKQNKYAIFVSYYLIVTQFLTNEFLASSLFFFILTILLLSTKNYCTKTT